MISDQDKGLVAAFEQTFDHSAHFCCSTHRGKNIQSNHNKTVRDQWEIARKASTALLLSAAKEGFLDFSPNPRKYLNNLPDEKQYPVSRLNMNADAHMYGRSSSSVVESMNGANNEARKVYGLDFLTAAYRLL